MATIPGGKPKLKDVFSQAELYDLVLAPFAVVTTWVSSYAFFHNHQPIRGWIMACTGFGVLIGGFIKAFLNYRKKKREQSTHELEGCLHTLHAMLTADSHADPSLRLTIHKPVDSNERLIQIIDYVGADRGRKKSSNRTFSGRSGIIGVALRTGDRVVGRRRNEDYAQYLKELVTDWGYTESDARNLNRESKSWMAIPLLQEPSSTGESGTDRAEICGVVFFDSTDPDFFTSEREEIAASACFGIARFVNDRYS